MANTTEVLKGLQIIEKYQPGAAVYAGERQIWAGDKELNGLLDPNDAQILESLGWFLDGVEIFGMGLWSCFC